MTTVYAFQKGIQGRRKDGTLVRGIIPQFDGSTYASTNCGACAEASRVVSQQKNVRPSKGAPWPPTGASIRRETGDTSGGLAPSQTIAASYREYGVPHASPRIDDWDNVPELLWKQYAVDLLVSYGPIDDYKSGSPGFRGNHRILLAGITDTGINRGLSLDSLYDGRRSAIPYGPQWIPLSILRSAAGRLDLGNGTSVNQRYGYGKAYYIPSLTRIETEPVTLKVKVTCDTIARRGMSIDSDKLGTLAVGDILTVTATSEGGHWSGCGEEGTKWRKFTHVNGKSTLSKWNRAYAYCAAGLTKAV